MTYLGILLAWADSEHLTVRLSAHSGKHFVDIAEVVVNEAHGTTAMSGSGPTREAATLDYLKFIGGKELLWGRGSVVERTIMGPIFSERPATVEETLESRVAALENETLDPEVEQRVLALEMWNIGGILRRLDMLEKRAGESDDFDRITEDLCTEHGGRLKALEKSPEADPLPGVAWVETDWAFARAHPWAKWPAVVLGEVSTPGPVKVHVTITKASHTTEFNVEAPSVYMADTDTERAIHIAKPKPPAEPEPLPEPGTLAHAVAEADEAGGRRVIWGADGDGWISLAGFQETVLTIWGAWEWSPTPNHRLFVGELRRGGELHANVYPALTRREARDAALDLIGGDFEFARVFRTGEPVWVVEFWTYEDACAPVTVSHTVRVDPITGVATEVTS